MLPSTGYFKTINCPFYDSGLCERPYCHFKHPRREDAAVTAASAAQALAGSQSGGAAVAASNSEMLQQLVSEAVKKVLAHQEVTDTNISKDIVSQVVEGLKPTLGPGSLASTSSANAPDSIIPDVIDELAVIPPPVAKPAPCVYNPTPIAELKKRHIPIASYMPTRDSKIAVKRKTSPDRIKPWLSRMQELSRLQGTGPISNYSGVKVGEITYKPTAIVTAKEASPVQSYVPTAKSDSSSSNSYDDGNSNDYVPKTKEQYRPKSKKKREEYVPKKLKAPLKTVQQLDDRFEPEFDGIITERTSPSLLASEDSQDYDPNVEPKFSDEEQVDENAENSTKEANKLEAKDKDSDIQEKERRSESRDKNKDSSRSSHKSSRSKSSRSKEDSNSSKFGHSKDKEKSKDKSGKEDSKRSKDKNRKERRSSSNHEKDNKETSSRDGERKEKPRHGSSSRDKHRSSSSSKDKHRSKETRSSGSRRSSRSGKDKDSGSRDKSRDQRSGSHGKQKSKSSSRKEKHSSDKDSDKKQLSSSGKASTSSKKAVKRKRNTSGSSLGEPEEREDSPAPSIQSMSPLSEEIMEISDSDHDVEEECLKIFQEYEVSDHPKEVAVREQTKREHEEVDEPGRKRVAHPQADRASTRQVGPSQPPKRLPNPQQRLYERWRIMREAAATAAAEKTAAAASVNSQPTVQTTSSQSRVPTQQPPATSHTTHTSESPSVAATTKSRLRIAHVPYATSLALAKKKVSEANKIVENKTIAQSSKGGSRVAHVPQAIPQLIRPEPLQGATQKFPLTVRQYYVNLMQDICVQIYTNAEDSAQRALREEFACLERCKAVNVYKNSCMLAAHRLRKELDQRNTGDACGSSASGLVTHESVLSGRSKGTWSVVKTKRAATEFKGAALYTMLMKWIMTEQQLRDNGFPRPHPDGPKGHAKIYVTNTRNKTILSKVPNERFCSRCGQPYMVDKFGNAVRQQNCIYHWGRKFTVRGEGRYSCCQQYGSASGCCDAKTHVWDYVDYENLRGYVKTLPKDHIAEEDQGVYALDCEMSYTTQGLELTRVTVINEDCHVIYETLVKPTHTVIDYNTRFSGITEEQMEGVTTTLLDVQATLLTMFSDKTILVGHSLESDFKAMKLLHDTVVDTSVMFPHKNGLPAKRALRNLCSEYLRKIIQNEIGGHDSNEDAVSCMELILWKVREEAKLQ